jgi:GT2 family glycosyltransferase
MTADRPIVSVCIANWNCCDMLRSCLSSLIHQDQGIALEVIVVDNASQDGAIAMVRSEFPGVHLIVNSLNHGFARASNQAAEVSRGEYLLFLNNDTEVPAGTLGKLVEYSRSNPKIGMVGPRLRYSDGSIQISYRCRPSVSALLHRTMLWRWTRLFGESYRRYRRGGFDPEHTGKVDLLMGAAVLAPRSVFFDSGKWDEDFSFGGEDLELAARIGRLHEVHYYPAAEITHHGRVSSRINVGFSTESVEMGYVQYLRKMGTSKFCLWLYKLTVTLDAPIQLLVKTVEFAGRRCFGRRKKAEKSWLVVRGYAYFLRRSLARFWKC